MKPAAVLAWLPLLLTAALGVDLTSGLSAAQIAALDAGRTVYTAEPVPGKAWPRARVYRRVDATPWEVMAVFADYEHASRFVPNVRVARVVETVHPWQQKVAYEIALPMLPNESYTALNTLSALPVVGGVKAAWDVNEARFIKSSHGNMVVVPYQGGSLVRYTNLVDPGSRIAVVLKASAQRQIRQTVEAICAEVGRRKRSDPGGLRRAAGQLQMMLEAAPR